MNEKSDFLKRVEEGIKKRNEAYKAWWEALPEARKNEYTALKVFNSDVERGAKEYHLKMCRDVLDLISELKPDGENKVVPIGLAIHGTVPVVFVAVGGRDKRGQNADEVCKYEKSSVSPMHFMATFDTNPFGMMAERHEPIPGMGVDWRVDYHPASE